MFAGSTSIPSERRCVERRREVWDASQVARQCHQARHSGDPDGGANSSTSATGPQCSSLPSTSTTVRLLDGSADSTRIGELRRVPRRPRGQQTPRGLDLHCIADNLSAHKTDGVKIRSSSTDNPHVHMHYTPTHASWLNQVELFFSILKRRVLGRGEFSSTDALAEKVIAFIKDYNKRAAPFRWTYDGRPLRIA